MRLWLPARDESERAPRRSRAAAISRRLDARGPTERRPERLLTGASRRVLVALAAVSTLVSLVSVTALTATAQDISALLALAGEGDISLDETEAFALADSGRYIKAREVAERVVKKNPSSYVGHFVLGYVQHYGEGNFPRALFHLEQAYGHYQRRYGEPPSSDAPWRWHARLLRELAMTHGALEHHGDKVRFLALYNEIYDPDLLADRAWPLMKMGRFDEARSAAEDGIASGNPRELEVALNALCAIEFEAGNDGASYEACKTALDHSRQTTGTVNAVDLTNFAEASRSLFKLDEAEQVLLEATDASVAWYGNPWTELAELYTREGRFPEALHALEKIPEYRSARPPHVQDSDRNEARRALAAFFVTVGRPNDALRITEKALVMPDRRAHNSRDPGQDRAIVALLDRRAHLMAAEMLRETAAGGSLWDRVVALFEAGWLDLRAFLSGRQASRLLSSDGRLTGIFRIGTSESAILPPWLAGEIIDVVGSGIAYTAIENARARDQRDAADAYYDAFAAEAALAMGDEEKARELGKRAEAGLGRAEALLAARVDALLARAIYMEGDLDSAAARYDAAFQKDPGIFRRLGVAIPVQLVGTGGEVAEEVRDALARSPRLDDVGGGLTVQIEASPGGAEACLLGAGGSVLGCGQAVPGSGDDVDDLVQKTVDAFHASVFAPRIDLSQADANSLDGSNRVSRDPLEGLGGEPSDLDL